MKAQQYEGKSWVPAGGNDHIVDGDYGKDAAAQKLPAVLCKSRSSA